MESVWLSRDNVRALNMTSTVLFAGPGWAADPVFQPMRAGAGGVRHVDMVAGTCQVDGDGRQAQPPAHGPLGWARGAASADIVQRELRLAVDFGSESRCF